jgi:hypothetical protein
MKEVIRKEILYDLSETINILEKKEDKDIEELLRLSNHAIEDVALHKDLDVISITVLIYSIYKTINCVKDEDYQILLRKLKSAKKNLESKNFGGYNRNIRAMFIIVKNCSGKVKEHLQNVMQAARIKKGTILLEHGLSIGQAAGLMGLSNWDLQDYASKTASLEIKHEKIRASRRMATTLKIFEIAKW